MSASTTFQVRFWKLKHMKGRRRPWGVRWAGTLRVVRDQGAG